jgi:hypothetical protein
MAYSSTRSIVEELEYEAEYWRDRAERAEAALKGDAWNEAVAPLTLQTTRVMRLLARRPMSTGTIVELMGVDYERFNEKGLKVCMCHARAALPEAIAPIRLRTNCVPYDVPDRGALKAFLGESE